MSYFHLTLDYIDAIPSEYFHIMVSLFVAGILLGKAGN